MNRFAKGPIIEELKRERRRYYWEMTGFLWNQFADEKIDSMAVDNPGKLLPNYQRVSFFLFFFFFFFFGDTGRIGWFHKGAMTCGKNNSRDGFRVVRFWIGCETNAFLSTVERAIVFVKYAPAQRSDNVDNICLDTREIKQYFCTWLFFFYETFTGFLQRLILFSSENIDKICILDFETWYYTIYKYYL